MSAAMRCPISTEIQFVRTLVPHEYMGSLSGGTKVMGLCLEEISFHYWPPGFLNGDNRLTHSVYYCNGWFRIVQAGHDHGTLCIHCEIIPGPDNLLYVIHFPLSSRTSMYQASTVRMNGLGTSCLGHALPAMMLLCADPVAFPTVLGGDSMFNTINNVWVGMTAKDIINGILAVVIQLGVEAIVSFIASQVEGLKAPREWASEPVDQFMRNIDNIPRFIRNLPLENTVKVTAEEIARDLGRTMGLELAEGWMNRILGDELAGAATGSGGPAPTVRKGEQATRPMGEREFEERATTDNLVPRWVQALAGEEF
jgi:hypothetical protein